MSILEYKKPTEDSIRRIKEVREAINNAAEVVYANTGELHSASIIAITKLEEASMWANKSIVFGQEEEGE